MRAIRTLVIISLLPLSIAIIVQAATADQSRPHIPGEVLVKFKSAMQPAERWLINHQARVKTVRSLGRRGKIQLIKLAPGMSVDQARKIFAAHPNVAYTEPNYILTTQTWSNDPYVDLQWALQNSGQVVAGYVGAPGADMAALAAWAITSGNRAVVVAVVDTGCSLSHPDLADNLWTNNGEIPDNAIDDDGNGYVDDYHGWDIYDHDNDPTDVSGHGTHVSGIIAAQAGNQVGGAGVAWQTRIMPVRFMDAFDRGTTADAIEAIQYAADQGARIINCSWGGAGFSKTLRDTMANTDALFICAAGNTATDNDDSPFYPASYEADNIISVAASDQMDRLTWFSNHGTQSVDVAAPGIRIYSSHNSRRTIWHDDFNDDTMAGWTTGGYPDSWAVVDPPYTENSPALATNAAGDYDNGADMWARSPAIDLSPASGCTASFQVVGVSQIDADKLWLETSGDLANWCRCPLRVGGTIINSGISGAIAYWTPVKADLGFLDGNSQAYLRLRFHSNAENTDTGFYIDNLALTASASDDAYSFMQGTSMAAGFVSGLAALVLSQNSGMTPQQIKAVIEKSVDLTIDLKDQILSGGRVNAYNALTLIEDLSLSADATASDNIHLTWTTNLGMRIDPPITIERRTDDQTEFSTVAQTTTDNGSYIDSTVVVDTTYYYRIRAATDDGDIGYSNQTYATAGQDTSSGGGSSGGGCFIGNSISDKAL
jgi:subtilisin family serine protease